MATSSKRKKTSSTGEKHREASPEKPTNDRKPKSRVFSEEDEIHLLSVFLDVVKDSPSPATAASALWDRVGKSLSGEITQTQLVEKLRKMRLKYSKQIDDESLIKTPHEREVFKISHKVWGENPAKRRSAASPSPKKAPRTATTAKKKKKEETETPKTPETLTQNNHTQTKTLAADDDEQQVETIEKKIPEGGLDLEKRFSFLMEEVSKLPANLGMRESLKGLKESELGRFNDRWRLQQIAEAKLLVMKTELIHEQTKLVLEGLASSSSSSRN